MAQESCNLDKDEAEVVKPSPSSPSNSSPPHPSSSSPLASSLLLLKQSPDVSGPHVELHCLPKSGKSRPRSGLGNWCTSCRKKVGLTGFRCRCGDLFCPRHRYSETHDCSFDYKAIGREEISKANPLVRAAKIIKIWWVCSWTTRWRSRQAKLETFASCFSLFA